MHWNALGAENTDFWVYVICMKECLSTPPSPMPPPHMYLHLFAYSYLCPRLRQRQLLQSRTLRHVSDVWISCMATSELASSCLCKSCMSLSYNYTLISSSLLCRCDSGWSGSLCDECEPATGCCKSLLSVMPRRKVASWSH